MFKKLFIYFFLIHTLLLTSSLADRWILVSTSVGDTIKVYIDKKNIRSNGNTVVWWQLDSYKEKLPESEHTIFSNIAKTEGDCLRDGKIYILLFMIKKWEKETKFWRSIIQMRSGHTINLVQYILKL